MFWDLWGQTEKGFSFIGSEMDRLKRGSSIHLGKTETSAGGSADLLFQMLQRSLEGVIFARYTLSQFMMSPLKNSGRVVME